MRIGSSPLLLVSMLTACFPVVEIDSTGQVGEIDTGDTDDTDDPQDDTGEPDDVIVGELSVSPSSVDYGLVFMGQTETSELSVTNVGETQVKVELTPEGDGASTLEVIPPKYTLEPGETSVHALVFTPNAWSEAFSAEVTVLDTLTEVSASLPVTAVVQEDADGDGWGSEESGGEDCDDADASVNPEAEETWYDGIDSDCAGDDDDDADADGVAGEAAGGTDCDDADAEVYPGAEETWYDGVDSDCDEASDYDADADGHDSEDYGGDDCDDADASVSPSTSETWYDGHDSDCDGGSDYDADSDGHDSDDHSGDDCDDSDASVNPSASETWYDGVDADCDGADDYDADGDGEQAEASGGTDCDDTDASVNTGAVDVWYDGVDTDCDGASDYDADSDGYDSDSYGGDDCDDSDSAISPAASETWYDGVDSDCDGDSDYDRDGDGYDSQSYGGDDCNDNNRKINPGATEIWYDGTDQDCDGASDYDADGDGLDSDDYSGTDCDDTDASIGAATDETLNSLDDDCDGTIDNLAVSDAASGVLTGMDTDLGLGAQGSFGLLEDVTGDGDVDVGVVSAELDEGYLWVVDGATAASGTNDIDDVDTVLIAGTSSVYTLHSLLSPAGDEDGDGTADLLFGSTSNSFWYSDYGAVALFTGGSGLSGSIDVSDYDAAVTGGSGSDNLSLGALGDIDGDGYADVVGGARYDSNYSGSYSSWTTDQGAVAVWAGGSLSGWYDVDDADDSILGTSSYDYLGSSLTLADLDDDGYVDIVAGAPGDDDGANDAGAVYIFSGNASLSWSSSADNAVTSKITGSSASDAIGEDTLPAPGDVDGDGDLDLLIPSEDEGEAWLFFSAGGLSSSPSVSSADHTWSGTAGDFASAAAIDSDLDGDGADEIAIGGDSADVSSTDSGVVYIYFYDSGWSSSLGASDADATIWGDDSGDYLGTGLAGGQDLDGDGLEDLLFGATGVDDSASEGGALYIIPGW